MTKEEIFKILSQSRQALLDSITGLTEAHKTAGPPPGGWDELELLGHIAAWDEICIAPLQALARQGRFEAERVHDLDAWNAGQAARRRGRTLEAARRELEDTRAALMAAAAGLDEARWRQSIRFPWGPLGTPAGLLEGLAEHEAEHAEILRQRPSGG